MVFPSSHLRFPKFTHVLFWNNSPLYGYIPTTFLLSISWWTFGFHFGLQVMWLWTFVFTFLCEHGFFWSIYLGRIAESLGDSRFNFLKSGISIVPPPVAYHQQGVISPHPPWCLFLSGFFNPSHPVVYLPALYFLNDVRIFSCVHCVWRNTYRNPPILQLDCLLLSFKNSLYNPVPVYDLQIMLPFSGLSFQLLDGLLHKIYHLDSPNLRRPNNSCLT